MVSEEGISFEEDPWHEAEGEEIEVAQHVRFKGTTLEGLCVALDRSKGIAKVYLPSLGITCSFFSRSLEPVKSPPKKPVYSVPEKKAKLKMRFEINEDVLVRIGEGTLREARIANGEKEGAYVVLDEQGLWHNVAADRIVGIAEDTQPQKRYLSLDEYRQSLWKRIKCKVRVVEEYQSKPWSYVRLAYQPGYDGRLYVGFGFAKWNENDAGVSGEDWDSAKGLGWARKRAKENLLDEVLTDGNR